MNDAEKRFRAKVNTASGGGPNGDCHLWLGQPNHGGYGRANVDGKTYMATHVAFFLAHDRWPSGILCHTCDFRMCVNPAHLFEGDNAINAADRQAKGRTVSGEQHGCAKLKIEQVREIRRLKRQGLTGRSLGALFGVSDSTISRVVNRSWGSLDAR